MAKRTPNGTNATSFNAGAGNPFNPSETAFHAYWGVYTWDASAAPNSVGGRSGAVGTKKLPNETNNPLTAPEFEKLRVGDTAGTAESSAVAGGTAATNGDEEGLFVCIYPGTVGGGNAVWVRLDNDLLASQTIRDAHVIVVAQDGRLATLSSVASPPMPANNLNLTAGVGDVASVTCDYLDAGASAELEQALLAAAAATVGIDIRLRPCDLDTSGVLAGFLVLPPGCRLLGAGRAASSIKGRTTGIGVVLQMEALSEISDLAITSPSPVSSSGPGTNGVIFTTATTGTRTRIKNCYLTMATNVNVDRQNRCMFWDNTATAEVMDTTFFGGTQTNQAIATLPTVAIVMGDWTQTATQVSPAQDFVVSRCHFEQQSKTSAWNQAVLTWNLGGARTGIISECEATLVRPRDGGFKFYWPADAASATATSLCPRIDNVRAFISDVEDAADSPYAGVSVNNSRNKQTVAMVSSRGVLVDYALTTTAVERDGIVIDSSNGSKIEGGFITDCALISATVGVYMAANPNSSVVGLRVTACDANNPVTAGGIDGTGFDLWADATTGALSNVGIQNCRSTNIPAAGAAVFIETATVSNTIVLGNHLIPSPGAGVAINDSGTNTEAAHNILA